MSWKEIRKINEEIAANRKGTFKNKSDCSGEKSNLSLSPIGNYW